MLRILLIIAVTLAIVIGLQRLTSHRQGEVGRIGPAAAQQEIEAEPAAPAPAPDELTAEEIIDAPADDIAAEASSSEFSVEDPDLAPDALPSEPSDQSDEMGVEPPSVTDTLSSDMGPEPQSQEASASVPQQ